jgi:hypothetical protein
MSAIDRKIEEGKALIRLTYGRPDRGRERLQISRRIGQLQRRKRLRKLGIASGNLE